MFDAQKKAIELALKMLNTGMSAADAIEAAQEMAKVLQEAIEVAVAAEREACAKVADRQCQSYDFRDYQEDALRSECWEIASQIRARTTKERT